MWTDQLACVPPGRLTLGTGRTEGDQIADVTFDRISRHVGHVRTIRNAQLIDQRTQATPDCLLLTVHDDVPHHEARIDGWNWPSYRRLLDTDGGAVTACKQPAPATCVLRCERQQVGEVEYGRSTQYPGFSTSGSSSLHASCADRSVLPYHDSLIRARARASVSAAQNVLRSWLAHAARASSHTSRK